MAPAILTRIIRLTLDSRHDAGTRAHMTPKTATPTPPLATGHETLGVVSFLNALPLYDTLTARDAPTVLPAVPSELRRLLFDGRCQVALLPIVDYWRDPDRLTPISDACIASDGETMTVRVFSNVPPDRVRRLHVDGDSHTSVILAQVVWLEMYATRLEIVPRRTGPPPAGGPAPQQSDHEQSVLLIGDKVVNEPRRGFGFEVDLGAAWKHLTGLPFVFAAWYGLAHRRHADIVPTLEAARDAGVDRVEEIAAEHAPAHGWSVDLAVHYLRNVMRYTLTPPMHTAMERFHQLAKEHRLLTSFEHPEARP